MGGSGTTIFYFFVLMAGVVVGVALLIFGHRLGGISAAATVSIVFIAHLYVRGVERARMRRMAAGKAKDSIGSE